MDLAIFLPSTLKESVLLKCWRKHWKTRSSAFGRFSIAEHALLYSILTHFQPRLYSYSSLLQHSYPGKVLLEFGSFTTLEQMIMCMYVVKFVLDIHYEETSTINCTRERLEVLQDQLFYHWKDFDTSWFRIHNREHFQGFRFTLVEMILLVLDTNYDFKMKWQPCPFENSDLKLMRQIEHTLERPIVFSTDFGQQIPAPLDNKSKEQLPPKKR